MFVLCWKHSTLFVCLGVMDKLIYAHTISTYYRLVQRWLNTLSPGDDVIHHHVIIITFTKPSLFLVYLER